MLKLSNNFNIVKRLIDTCEINIEILNKKGKVILYKNKENYLYDYVVNAVFNDILTHKTLIVKNIKFSRNETIQNKDTLTLKTDIRLDFSLEEHVCMFVVGEAGFYQKYINSSNIEKKNIIKKISTNYIFKSKHYYDFIVTVLKLKDSENY